MPTEKESNPNRGLITKIVEKDTQKFLGRKLFFHLILAFYISTISRYIYRLLICTIVDPIEK